MSYLDPTGIPTGDDTFLVYYATAPNGVGDREYTLEQAPLRVGAKANMQCEKKKKKKKKKKKC
jgi:hypothetical protein